MPLALPGDAGALRDIREGPVSVVVEQVVSLALRVHAGVLQVGLDENAQPAVPVVVAEGGHAARVLHIQPVGMGHLPEGPVPLVDVEEVRGSEAADIDVQPAAVVYVDEGGALVPHAGRRADINNSGRLDIY